MRSIRHWKRSIRRWKKSMNTASKLGPHTQTDPRDVLRCGALSLIKKTLKDSIQYKPKWHRGECTVLVGNPPCILTKERRLKYLRHARSCRGRGQRATRAEQRAARREVQKHKPTRGARTFQKIPNERISGGLAVPGKRQLASHQAPNPTILRSAQQRNLLSPPVVHRLL